MNIKKKLIRYSKILVTFALSFFIAGTLNNEIFIANSPQIREDVGSHLVARARSIMSGNAQFVANIFNPYNSDNLSDEQKEKISTEFARQTAEKLQNAPLKAVSKGVYAKEDEDISYTEIRLGQVTWREYTLTIDGEVVKIRIPADGQQPSVEELQQDFGDLE